MGCDCVCAMLKKLHWKGEVCFSFMMLSVKFKNWNIRSTEYLYGPSKNTCKNFDLLKVLVEIDCNYCNLIGSVEFNWV